MEMQFWSYFLHIFELKRNGEWGSQGTSKLILPQSVPNPLVLAQVAVMSHLLILILK